jgi:predicted alpha/beta-fold hydrolase
MLSRAKRIHLFGYSIGGHISLSYACGPVDPRVTKVCAVGSPLHLASAADDFDAARFNVYRSHVMDSLKEIYTAAFQRNPSGIEPVEARQIQTIRQWDERVIAPRFGFAGAEHYYQTQSVGPRLSALKVDALYIGALNDPMVRARGVAPHLDVPRLKSVWCSRAGHLGFALDFDFGQPGPVGLEDQVIAWFRS